MLQAVIDSLLKKGMAQAESVILTGCSGMTQIHVHTIILHYWTCIIPYTMYSTVACRSLFVCSCKYSR